MKFVTSKYRRNGAGDIRATITLIADDETTQLYEDSFNLSKQSARKSFADSLIARFPDMKGKDIEAQLLQLLWKTKEPEEKPEKPADRPTQGDILVTLAIQKGVELFHTPMKAAYARIPIDNHSEIHQIRSQSFKSWLSNQLYIEFSKSPNSDSLNSAITTLEGMALFGGEIHDLQNRVAWHEGAIWYDLSDSKWRAVKISANGFEIVNKPPILFYRFQHQRPQVEPGLYGDIGKLRRFINLCDQDQWRLLSVSLITSLVPDIPHPIPELHGEQGSAKSMLMRLFKKLVDPSAEELLMLSRDENTLIQKLYHHYFCAFDNLSVLPSWVSDLFCKVVSGVGFSKRTLYTDQDDIIFQIKRVIAINGINIVAAKPDLLDRCILFELQRIAEDKRREEKKFLEDFESAKAEILTGMFDALSKALAIYPTLNLEKLPRMADFAVWGVAVALALGYSSEDFMKDYRENISQQNTEVLVSNPLASAIMAFMESKVEWEGTASDLGTLLVPFAEEQKINIKSKDWPSAPQVLTRRLNEIKTNLRNAGIFVETTTIDGKRLRKIKIFSNPLLKDAENTDNIDNTANLDTKSPVGNPDGILKIPSIRTGLAATVDANTAVVQNTGIIPTQIPTGVS